MLTGGQTRGPKDSGLLPTHWQVKPGPGVSARPLIADCFLESGCRSGSPEPFPDCFLGQSGEDGMRIGGEYLLIQLSKGCVWGGPKAWVGLLSGYGQDPAGPRLESDLRGRS